MSRFPHNTGILSGHMTLAVILWITVQISFTLLAVYAPVYFNRLIENKQKRRFLHIISLLAGGALILTSSMLTLGTVGYNTLDSIFPPVVCYAAEYRSVAIYVFLIPSGLFDAIIISELIVLYHFLVR